MSRPSASTPCISYWVISPSELVACWSGISSVSGSRLMTTPAAWVEALRATPSSCSARLEQLAHARIRVAHLAQRGRDVEGFFELDAELVGNGLGDAVDLAVAQAQDAAHVADGGAREHRAEGDDLGDVVAAVLARDVVDHLAAARVLEVDVDVRHGHAIRVEEALEGQLVLDRVDRRDAQRVGHDRARRAAAAGGRDLLLAGEAHEVGDDQEVGGVAHRDDHAELVVEPLLERFRHLAVALAQAALALGAQPRLDRVAIGHGEIGQARLAQRQLEIRHLGDQARVRDCLRHVGERALPSRRLT